MTNTASTKDRATYEYTVIEDNAGGLHLFLFRPGHSNPEIAIAGYEYNPGHLTSDLNALDAGDDASAWEGKIDDPTELWIYMMRHEYGYKIVCDKHEGERTVYPERMGRSARIEFITTEEDQDE